MTWFLVKAGSLTKAKDTLMRTFGSSWKEASINGKVVSITKNTWRVEWSIGGVGITLDHGKGINVLLLLNEYFCP